MVACRAHNPKVARFESRLRNHMDPGTYRSGIFYTAIIFIGKHLPKSSIWDKIYARNEEFEVIETNRYEEDSRREETGKVSG